MKKILLLSGLVLLFSCDKQHQDTRFTGFAGFDIGTEFASLPDSKSFTKTMADEYNVPVYELGDGIGRVSNLNVSTEKGKIIAVSFNATADTDLSKIRSSMGDLTRIEPDSVAKKLAMSPNIDLALYVNPQQNLFLAESRSAFNEVNGKPQIRFQYCNELSVKKSRNLILSLIGDRRRSKAKIL